jgi:hypothetical protein
MEPRAGPSAKAQLTLEVVRNRLVNLLVLHPDVSIRRVTAAIHIEKVENAKRLRQAPYSKLASNVSRKWWICALGASSSVCRKPTAQTT